MHDGITYVGLDAHKKAINVSMLLADGRRPIEWQLANEAQAVRRMARKLKREAPGEVVCCYEAGPCGYVLQRQLESEGIACRVIAPGLIPAKPGERIKTDRRDARKLAELLRAGLLTEVRPPTPAEEAARDLCRCREDAKQDLLRCRHHISKMLLRRGWFFHGNGWTKAHRRWLETLRFEHEWDQAAFDDYLLALAHVEERLKTLDAKIAELAGQDTYREKVGWLRCFRGIDTVTAMTLLTELHDFDRFRSPRELVAFLGLVPKEHSSSDRRRLGGITRAGNRHVRHVLVESAWHYRHAPRVGGRLSERRKGQPAWVIAVADKAQQRLYRRYVRLVAHGKPTPKAVVAITRELVGFVWSVLHRSAQTLEAAPAA